MIKTTEIKIGNLKFNGKDCENPVVTYIGSSNLTVKCIDDKNQVYRVQTLDTDANAGLPDCLTFVVSCGECSECESKVIEKCLCEDASDCGPCQDCISGICVDRCNPGQDCVNGRCVDCKSDDDCPCNQQCLPSGCACPTGWTLNAINNCCDQCQSDKDCGPCHDCVEINGAKICVERPCADGVCDPETGNCVECLTSADCANKSCKHCDVVLNKCVAIPGTQLQVTDGQCIDSPECISDVDCANCEMCGKNGKCAPVLTCGPDQILDKKSCKCVQRCDCNAPDCPEGYYCAAVDNHNNCGCFKCEGDCTNGCVEPCFCSQITDKCISSPCSNKPCTEGIDCGPGCGCKDGKCVPCQAEDCNSLNPSCLTVKGCICSGTQCIGDDCGRTPCDNTTDCGPGCTCYKGECTGCSNFSCDGANNCAQQVGCKCVSGNCVDDPDDRDCKDDIIMEATDQGCNLIGMLTKETPCYCTHLVINSGGKIINSTSDEVEVEMVVQVRKNIIGPDYDIANLPLLSDVDNPDIALNETPVEGMFDLKVTSFEQYNDQGQIKNTERQIAQTSASLPANQGDETIAVFNTVKMPKIGTTYTDAQGFERTIVSVSIQVFRKSTIKIIGNNCEYRNTDGQSPFAIYRITSNSEYDFSTTNYNRLKGKQITSSSARYPMFKWYRGNTILKKHYVAPDQGDNKKYVDILDQNEFQLESCEQYTLEVDCTCASPVQETFVWKKGELEVEPLDCGLEFKIKKFDTCRANITNTFYIKWGNKEETWTPGEEMYFPTERFSNDEECIGTIDWGIKCGSTYHSFEEPIVIPCTQFDPPVVTKTCTNDGKLKLTYPNELISQSGNKVRVLNVYISPAGLNAYQVPEDVFVSNESITITVEPGIYDYRLVLDTGCEYESDGTVGDSCCSHKETLPGYWSKFYRDASDNNMITGIVKNNSFTIPPDTTVYDKDNIIDRLRDADGYNQSITVVETDSEGCTKNHLIEAGCATWNNTSFIAEATTTVGTARIVPIPKQSVDRMVLTTTNPDVQITKRSEDWAVSNLIGGTNYTFTVVHDSCPGSKTVNLSQPGCVHSVELAVNTPNCNTLTTAITGAINCKCPNYDGSIRVQIVDLRQNDMDIKISSLANLLDPSLKVTQRQLRYDDGNGYQNVADSNCDGETFNCSGTITVPRPVTVECLDQINLRASFSSGSQPNYVKVRLSLLHGNGSAFDDFVKVYVNNVLQNAENLVFEAERGDSVDIRVEVTQSNQEYTQLVELDITGTQGSANIPLAALCTEGSTGNGEDIAVGVFDLGLNDNCKYSDFEMSFNTLDLLQANNEISKDGSYTPLQANVRHKKLTYYERAQGQDWVEILALWTGGSSHTLDQTYTQQGAEYRSDVFCNCLKKSPEVPLCCMPELDFTANACVDSVTIELDGLPGVYDVVAGYRNDYQTDPNTVTHQITIPPATGGSSTNTASQLFDFPQPLLYGTRYFARVVSVSDSCVEEESWETPSRILYAGVVECQNPGVSALYDLALTVTVDNVNLTSAQYSARLINTPPAGVTWDQGNQKIRGLNNTGNMMGQVISLEVTPNIGSHAGCVSVYEHPVETQCAQPVTLACPTCNNLPQGNTDIPTDDPTAVEVSWTAVTGATGYGIEIFEGSIGNKILEVKKDATPSFRSFNMLTGTGQNDGLGSLDPGVTYLIRVTSYEDTDPTMTPDCTGSMLTVTTAAVAGCDTVDVDVIATTSQSEFAFYASSFDQSAADQSSIVPTPDPTSTSGFVYDFKYRCNKERVSPNAIVESNVRDLKFVQINYVGTKVSPGITPVRIRLKVAMDGQSPGPFAQHVDSNNMMMVSFDAADTTEGPNIQCDGCNWYNPALLTVPAGGVNEAYIVNLRQALINRIAQLEGSTTQSAGSQLIKHGRDYKIYFKYYTSVKRLYIGFANKYLDPVNQRSTWLLMNWSGSLPPFTPYGEAIVWDTNLARYGDAGVYKHDIPDIYIGTSIDLYANYWIDNVDFVCNWGNQCNGQPVAISMGVDASYTSTDSADHLVFGDPMANMNFNLINRFGPTISCDVVTLSAVVSGCDPSLGTPQLSWTDNSTGQTIGTGSNVVYDVENVNAQYSLLVINCCGTPVTVDGIIPTNNPA